MQERLIQLVRATSALITDMSLDGVLHRVVQVAADVIEARYAIGVVGPDGKVLESITAYGIDPELQDHIGPPPSGRGVLGLVIREKKPIRLTDLGRHPDSCGFPPNHPPMRSFRGTDELRSPRRAAYRSGLRRQLPTRLPARRRGVRLRITRDSPLTHTGRQLSGVSNGPQRRGRAPGLCSIAQLG